MAPLPTTMREGVLHERPRGASPYTSRHSTSGVGGRGAVSVSPVTEAPTEISEIERRASFLVPQNDVSDNIQGVAFEKAKFDFDKWKSEVTQVFPVDQALPILILPWMIWICVFRSWYLEQGSDF